jgi:hypothetical protein
MKLFLFALALLLSAAFAYSGDPHCTPTPTYTLAELLKLPIERVEQIRMAPTTTNELAARALLAERVMMGGCLPSGMFGNCKE